MNYYYVAYGHETRISEKCASPEAAMRYCYGMIDNRMMSTYLIGTRSPKYMSQKAKTEILTKLEKFHKQKTTT